MKKILTMLAIALFAIPTSSQVVFTDFKAFSAFALQHNTDLSRSLLGIAVEQQNYRSAISPLLPYARAGANLTDNLILPTQLVPKSFVGGSATGYYEIKFGTTYTLAPTAEASVNLINAANYQNLKIAGSNQQLAQENYSLSKEELQKNLAALYYGNLLLTQNLQFASENYRVADSLYAVATLKYQQGIIDELEMSRSKSLMLTQEQVKEQSYTLLEKNKLDLKLAAGIPMKDDIQINDQIMVPSDLPTISYDPMLRPAYKVAAYKAYIARQTVTKNKLLFAPELSAFANYGYNAQNNKFDFFNKDQRWYKSSAIGLKLDIPLFAGASKYFNLERSKLNEKIALQDMDFTRAKLDKEYLELKLDVSRYRTESKNTKELLDIANRNYELAILKYQGGVLSYDAVQSVFKELLSAQQNYLDRTANYTISAFKLQLSSQP